MSEGVEAGSPLRALRMNPGVSMIVKLGQWADCKNAEKDNWVTATVGRHALRAVVPLGPRPSARMTMGLLWTAPPPVRRSHASVRARMTSATPVSGSACQCGGHEDRSRRRRGRPWALALTLSVSGFLSVTYGRPVLLRVLLLEMAARLMRVGVVEHLHHERPPRAHLRLQGASGSRGMSKQTERAQSPSLSTKEHERTSRTLKRKPSRASSSVDLPSL